MNRFWLYISTVLLVVLVSAYFTSPALCSFLATYGRAPITPIDELERMPVVWALLYTAYDAVVVFFRVGFVLSYVICRG